MSITINSTTSPIKIGNVGLRLAGLSSYLHIRWGNSLTPSELLTEPSDYIGLCASHNPEAPTEYISYQWFKYKGTGITGIRKIIGDGSAGSIDVYRISISDGTYFDFSVKNGTYFDPINLITPEERIKLQGIATGAEVNVQADFGQTDDTKDDFIKNKPTLVSQFENDSGYLTSHAVKSVNDKTGFVVLTQDDVGDGTTNKQFSNTEKQKLAGIATGAEVNVNPDWNSETGKSKILNKPTTVSGYGITDAYTKAEVDNRLSSVYEYRGSVPMYEDLPTENVSVGHVYNVLSNGENFAWTGESWDSLAGVIPTATQTNDGLMSITDKTKLDGIATGAEVNVNPDWNAIEGDAVILNKPTTVSGYGITDVYNKTESDSMVEHSIQYRGEVESQELLPLSPSMNDVYKVVQDHGLYIFLGNGWYRIQDNSVHIGNDTPTDESGAVLWVSDDGVTTTTDDIPEGASNLYFMESRVTDILSEHEEKIASPNTLAHVKPVSADNTMILPVGADADGKLWTSPDILSQIYGVRWDMVNSQCTRCFASADLTTTTTNFGYFGSVNTNYLNPFDNIYPWSGRKLCNISLNSYLALTSEDSIVDCVTAWENGVGFNMEHADGVWVYTPEYWYRRWDKDGFRYIAVSGVSIDGWNYSPERIRPRWKGVMEDRVIEGATKTILLPKIGQPAASVAMSSMHGYAKNANMTLENIYSFDAEAALYLVEYANMNSQTALGNGVSDLYRQSGYTIQSNTTDSDVIQILASQASTFVIQGATLDIGTTDGGMQIGRFMVVSSTVNSINNMLLDVTIDRATSVTTAHFWSIHGLTNVLDTDIGSKSGYIGTNGRCNVYYRGNTIYSNRHSYILGVYREKDTGHIWIASNEVSADEVDALDITKHIDTGLVLPQGNGGASYSGYIKTMGVYGNLVLPPFCTIGGGNSSDPVGDSVYTSSLNTINTVLISGGNASIGSNAGLWCGIWHYSAANSSWSFSAFPLLKTP